jgi:hypothetical protein
MALSAAMLVLGAGPALADPAGPTNYESTVTSVDPANPTVVFEVTGGDAFLDATVAPGHTVLVPGYFSEPYIRIDADGSVWINQDSPAFFINDDRYADATVPEGVDGKGEPQWKQVGSGGRYAWHDHRVHWMSYDLPPTVDGDRRELVFPWELPVVVDGVDTTIAGDLVFVPSLSPLPALLAGVVALLPLTVRRRSQTLALALLAAVASSIAAVVTIAQNNGTPPSARSFPIWVVFPAVALAAASWAVTRGNLWSFTRHHLLFVSGLTLLAWAVATIDVLTAPLLPSAMPVVLERASVGFVLWAGAGIAVVAAVNSVRLVMHRRTPAPAVAGAN